MKREQVRAIMPILQAFIDGKKIEGRPKGFSNDFEGWRSVDEISGLDSIEYRIKPEPTYRPFKNAEECWQEMLKHKPFGWVKSNLFKDFDLVQRVTTLYVEINREIIDNNSFILFSFIPIIHNSFRNCKTI